MPNRNRANTVYDHVMICDRMFEAIRGEVEFLIDNSTSEKLNLEEMKNIIQERIDKGREGLRLIEHQLGYGNLRWEEMMNQRDISEQK